MDPQPSTSQKDVDVFLSPRKKRPRKAFTVTEKEIIRNAYKYVKNEISAQSEAFEVVEENECEVNKGAPLTPPKKTGPKRSFKDKIDEFTFSAIRRIVHQFFYRNEPPTISKILQVMNDDPEMPKISKDTLRKILKHLNFKFVARSRKSTLIDRNDIITWRQRYLRSICQFRREGRHIYYQDEAWVNAGHTVKKTWVDKKILGGGNNIRAEQTPRVNVPQSVDGERRDGSGERREAGARLTTGVVVALGAFGALVFLVAIITTIVILVRRKHHDGKRYRHHVSPDCNTVASLESSSSESRSGLNRYYRQAWEELHEAAGAGAKSRREREAPKDGSELVVSDVYPPPHAHKRRHHHHHREPRHPDWHAHHRPHHNHKPRY
ncbi:hypothetical protein ACJJTC_000987 [Scirpophaga incertulas]